MLERVQVSDVDRAELERRVGLDSARERDRLRAQVVLLAAEGLTNREIARRIGLRHEHVGVWRQRYVAEGLLGLEDRERDGRPPLYGPEVRELIRSIIRRIAGNPTWDWWTYRAVAAELPPELGISISQLRRICLDMGLEQGVPVFFVDEDDEGGLSDVPLYTEPEAVDPWPEASSKP